jgi:hypothetical protein
VLGIVGDVLELRIRDLGDDARSASPEHLSDATPLLRIGRVALERGHEALPGRIAVGRRQSMDAVVLLHIDQAIVGDARSALQSAALPRPCGVPDSNA